jgi:hypothetical protein
MTRMRAVIVSALTGAALALAGAGCGGRVPAASQPPANSLAQPTPTGTPSAVTHRKHERSAVFTATVSGSCTALR